MLRPQREKLEIRCARQALSADKTPSRRRRTPTAPRSRHSAAGKQARKQAEQASKHRLPTPRGLHLKSKRRSEEGRRREGEEEEEEGEGWGWETELTMQCRSSDSQMKTSVRPPAGTGRRGGREWGVEESEVPIHSTDSGHQMSPSIGTAAQ